MSEATAVAAPVELQVPSTSKERRVKSDEEQMAATKSGNIEAILRLMTDDVVFLVPGRPVMRKAK